MTDRIEPRSETAYIDGTPVRCDDYPRLIAVANAALPDSDPRKITRAMVVELRKRALGHPLGYGEWSKNPPDPELTKIADALESYLPPEA